MHPKYKHPHTLSFSSPPPASPPSLLPPSPSPSPTPSSPPPPLPSLPSPTSSSTPSSLPQPPSSTKQYDFSCLLMGEVGIGKTCLIERFVSGSFPNYVPVHLQPEQEFSVGSTLIRMRLSESALEDPSLARIDIQHADFVLVCFSVVQRRSFDHINELVAFIKALNKPFAVVGLQTDLRETKQISEPYNVVTAEEGENEAKVINASFYKECSSWTGLETRKVFTDVAVFLIDCSEQQMRSEALRKELEVDLPSALQSIKTMKEQINGLTQASVFSLCCALSIYKTLSSYRGELEKIEDFISQCIACRTPVPSPQNSIQTQSSSDSGPNESHDKSVSN